MYFHFYALLVEFTIYMHSYLISHRFPFISMIMKTDMCINGEKNQKLFEQLFYERMIVEKHIKNMNLCSKPGIQLETKLLTVLYHN